MVQEGLRQNPMKQDPVYDYLFFAERRVDSFPADSQNKRINLRTVNTNARLH